MPSATPNPHTRDVPDPASRTTVHQLIVETDSEPIRGELRGPDGGTRRFHGWIELISVLERAHLTPHDTPINPAAGKHHGAGAASHSAQPRAGPETTSQATPVPAEPEPPTRASRRPRR